MFFKKIGKFFIALALFSTNVFADDFLTLPNPINSKNSVIEVFSYQCIHCYNHHKYGTLEKLKQSMPNLHYELYPVSLMNGKFGKELNALFAYAKFTDEQNNKDAADDDSLTHKLADAYFTAHFVNQQDFQNLDDFYKVGLSVMKVQKSDIENFLNTTQAKEILDSYAKANEIAANTGTPAFVVNGKYQIKPEAVTSLDALEKLVKELLQK